MKNKFQIFIDAIFSFILFSFVFYALFIRYSTQLLSALGAVDAALILQTAYLGHSRISMKKGKLKENFRNFFIFTPVNCTEYFANALSVRYKTEKKDGSLTVGDAYVYFALALSPLSYANVVEAFKKRTRDKIVIMCFSYDKKARRLAQSLPADVRIMDEDAVFSLLYALKALPTTQVRLSPKYPIKNLLHDLANAKLNKRLLFSALIVTLFSFITPFKNYYVFFALILLVLCVIPSFVRLVIKRG